jgi:lipopolysaccharide biosynthesis protein
LSIAIFSRRKRLQQKRMSDQNFGIRALAFYLPQFHPVPENDEWWGKGFTEWTNVAKARPEFPWHYQPHIPADLGFYDLRLPETREAQVEMAREYGIYGFVYYHYWFNGKQILHRPFDEVLGSGRPDFPFCLCWANENWTRTWDGLEKEVLLTQRYSEEDDRQHLRRLARAFEDPRYIRLNGKPLFLVYRPSAFPNPRGTAARWREEAYRLGLGEIYLARVESFSEEPCDPADLGFDAAVEFQPDVRKCGHPLNQGVISRAAHRLGLAYGAYRDNAVFDYIKLVERSLGGRTPVYTRFRCVMPSWDNTPRRQGRATIYRNASPAAYERWLRGVIERSVPVSPEEDLVFINAWNEWGEGNHLEPCLKWGRAYLEATQRALAATRGRVLSASQ